MTCHECIFYENTQKPDLKPTIIADGEIFLNCSRSEAAAEYVNGV